MDKRYLRSFQTRFPAIRSAKFRLKNFATRNFGMFIDADFQLLRDLRPVGLVIDVGGNWGQSIHAFQTLAKPSRILSFEPSPYLSTYLAKSFSKDPSVTVEPVALGNSDGSFQLFTPVYDNYVWDGLASTIYEDAAGWLNSETLAGFDQSKLSISTDAVIVKTLDSYALDPDVIKIDVQGAELSVVEGGIEMFRRCKPVALIEDPKPELVSLLASVGLSPFRLHGKSLVRNDFNSINTVFLSDEKCSHFAAMGYQVA